MTINNNRNSNNNDNIEAYDARRELMRAPHDWQKIVKQKCDKNI